MGSGGKVSKRVSTLDPLAIWADSGVLTTTRMLYLGGEISQESVDIVIKGILALESLDPTGKITLILSSEGGAYYPALALYDALRATSCPTTIKVLGHCMSSAVVILQGADHRVISENARILIHDGTEGYEGEARNFEKWGKQCVLDRQLMYDIFASRSKCDQKWFDRNCQHDKFLTPTECISLGLADEILTKYVQQGETP